MKGKLQKNKTIAKRRKEKKTNPGQKQYFSPLRIYMLAYTHAYVKMNAFTFNSYLPSSE